MPAERFYGGMHPHLRIGRALFLALSLPPAPGCRSMRNRALTAGPEQVQYKGFTYRPLSPGDFRAPDPPDHLVGHAHRINAYSTIRIRPTPGSRLVVTQGELFGSPIFSAASSTWDSRR